MRVCPHHCSPWDVFRAAYFAEHPVVVLKASRGFGGKTTLLGLLAVCLGATLKADVTVLGGSGGQSARVMKAMLQFWSAVNAPRHVLRSDPGRMRTVFEWGNEIEALTASQRSVRSPHPQRLLLDEVDEMDIDIFNAAMGQTMSARGIPASTLVSSTHQNPAGTMTAVLKMAAEKGWPVMEYCWRETVEPHGWLLLAEVERKRTEMTEAMWRTEVELQEPSASGLAITREAVEVMFDTALGETDGEAGRDEEFEAPAKSGVYAHGADWGKRHDFSAIPTLRTDCAPWRFVALYRDRRKPYHLMAPQLNFRLDRYGGTAAHDANGVGEAVGEHLTHEVEGYTQWVGAPRHVLFNEYINAIERGRVKAPRSLPWYNAHKWVTNNDLYGTGHPPDEFVGCALAYRAATHGAGTLMLVGGDSAPRQVSEAEAREKEKAKKEAAQAVVEDAIRTTGVFWPGGHGGQGGGRW